MCVFNFCTAGTSGSDLRSSHRSSSSAQNGVSSSGGNPRSSHRPSSGIEQQQQQNIRQNRTSSTSSSRPPMPLPPPSERPATMRPMMPLPPYPSATGSGQRRSDPPTSLSGTPPSSRSGFNRPGVSPEPSSTSSPVTGHPPPVVPRRQNRSVLPVPSYRLTLVPYTTCTCSLYYMYM